MFILMQESPTKKLCYIAPVFDNPVRSEIRNAVCRELPAKYLDESQSYCVLHAPNSTKSKSFLKEIRTRLEHGKFDFRSVYFPDTITFTGLTFHKTADFTGAIFCNTADFSETKFSNKALFGHIEFKGDCYFERSTFTHFVEFTGSTFSEFVDFREAIFNSAVMFLDATFEKTVYFHHASFNTLAGFSSVNIKEKSQVLFYGTNFDGVASFEEAIIEGYVAFEGLDLNSLFSKDETYLNLQNAKIEKPERLSFHSVRLRPNWFINVDCRRFVFTACVWKMVNGRYLNCKTEIEALKNRYIPNSYKLLTKTCWQLADNYEDNKSFRFASVFRQLANESNRLEEYKGFKIWSLGWWYWLSSYYGESWIRATGILGSILGGFAIIYMFTDFQVCPMIKSTPEVICEIRALTFWESLRQSFATATFQTVEFRKVTNAWGEAFITMEKILAPLQAALLALAIRRKFMR